MECLLPYLCNHIMVGLERMSDYKGVGLARFHCIIILVVSIHCVLICMHMCSGMYVYFDLSLSCLC